MTIKKKWTLLFACYLPIALISCDDAAKKLGFYKRDTVLIYFTDSLPVKSTYHEAYNNFTETRNVMFRVSRNWDTKTYHVSWSLWIDGEIPEQGDVDVKPDEVEKYKAKISRIENDRIPKLLTVWQDN